jgi:hypothetical protein
MFYSAELCVTLWFSFFVYSGGNLKVASFVLTLFFILAFAGALSLMPAPGDITAPLSVHVSARYDAQSALETGWTLPLAAVLGDYRSFDPDPSTCFSSLF